MTAWHRCRAPKAYPRIFGASLFRVLAGLAALVCSCTTKPADSALGTDSSVFSGGSTTGGTRSGGAGGRGSGGVISATGSGGGASRDATGGMGSGGQAGGTGGVAPGVGGSGSGGASMADAGMNRDTGPDLPAKLDAAARLDAATAFWTNPFVPNCTPPPMGGRSQSDGHHHGGEDCMQSGCHAGGSPNAGAAFLFGGTVRRAGSLASYPSVEVAVRTPAEFYSACSAANGNFWVVAVDAGSLDWNAATTRVRSSNGESVMLPAPEAACSSCHSQVMLLTAP